MSGTRGAAPWLRFEIGGERFALPIEAVAQVVGLTRLQSAGAPGWAGLLALRDGVLPIADGASLVGHPEDPPALGRALVLRGRFPLGMSVDSVLGLGSGVACPLVARVGLPELTMAAIPAADRPTLVLDPDRLWRRIWSSLEALPGDAGFRLAPLRPTAGEHATERRGDGATGRPGKEAYPIAAELPRTVPAPLPVLTSQIPVAAPATVGIAACAGAVESRPSVRTPSPVPTIQARVVAPNATPSPRHPTSPSLRRVLVFRAGLDLDLGVAVEQVLEVGPERTPRPIPGGPGHLVGMLEWRGRLVPMVDLAARLGTTVSGPRRTLYLALTGRAARALAVQVGEVIGEALVPPTQDEQVQVGLPPEWVVGVTRVDERRLAILEASALLVA